MSSRHIHTNAVVTCKMKAFLNAVLQKNLAAVDDRRKIIILQRVENVPKTFLEKWAWRNSDVV